jgi:hypothetical protein
MLVRKLTEDDLKEVWALRLQALRDNPEAFGSTYEEAFARGETWMLHRLSGKEDETFYLGLLRKVCLGWLRFIARRVSRAGTGALWSACLSFLKVAAWARVKHSYSTLQIRP